MTRRDVFDYIRGEGGPWWGRLEETDFLKGLYDLDGLASTDSRFATVRGDNVQHRINNPLDWPDDWVLEDPRFRLLDGPDEVFLAFLARLVHPEVLPDADQSSQRVEKLNRLLGPDGWALRAVEFLSGRPIYTPVRTQATGPLVSLPLDDDDTGKLDLVLGQTHSLLDRDGEEVARDLLRPALLTLRRDGGFYHPMPGDGWTADTYEAVLIVDRALLPAFTEAVTEAIWQRLEAVLARLQRDDVQTLVVEGDIEPLPAAAPDWRNQTAEFNPSFVRGLRIAFPSKEFDVARQDFSDLEIRGRGFSYFYDTRTDRVITDFLLDDRPLVATLCHVTLIDKGGALSPRIKLWKKDKTRTERTVAREAIPGTEATHIVKALVDTSDVYENFWKVICFIQNCVGLGNIPGGSRRLFVGDEAELARLLADQDRTTLLEAVRTAIGGALTEEDIRRVSNRKWQLQRFKSLLTDTEFFERERVQAAGPEAVWQRFFEENPWIFGYGLNLVACEPLDDGKLERITTGANIFTGAGKRSDAVMRSKGFISSLLLCEIKTHVTPLLASAPYRPPDVYQVSKDVVGAVAQVQKTAHKALRLITGELHRLYRDDGAPTDIEISTARPRQVLVIGSLSEFTERGATNPEKMASFEQYRRSIQDVEVITFDELYERACFIVEDR
ncbi:MULTISPECIES: Shedu anti-phage system protein SduA domain-containing protein [Streptomyces]|uniref:Shedu anti-phage system protein SduA domain-containing protein n=1 Tax=Streptomyces TaxID=1883 RepID=UPI00221F0C0C|nr:MULTISPECIES: Shedu anti-phage system protein SduA domain-containing protein [Streptomyces]